MCLRKYDEGKQDEHGPDSGKYRMTDNSFPALTEVTLFVPRDDYLNVRLSRTSTPLSTHLSWKP